MERRPNWRSDEVKALQTAVGERRTILYARRSTPQITSKKKDAWREIAAVVQAVGYADRTPEECRRKHSDFTSRLRQKLVAQRRQALALSTACYASRHSYASRPSGPRIRTIETLTKAVLGRRKIAPASDVIEGEAALAPDADAADAVDPEVFPLKVECDSVEWTQDCEPVPPSALRVDQSPAPSTATPAAPAPRMDQSPASTLAHLPAPNFAPAQTPLTLPAAPPVDLVELEQKRLQVEQERLFVERERLVYEKQAMSMAAQRLAVEQQLLLVQQDRLAIERERLSLETQQMGQLSGR